MGENNARRITPLNLLLAIIAAISLTVTAFVALSGAAASQQHTAQERRIEQMRQEQLLIDKRLLILETRWTGIEEKLVTIEKLLSQHVYRSGGGGQP